MNGAYILFPFQVVRPVLSIIRSTQLVALKILVSELGSPSNEKAILQRLASSPDTMASKSHIVSFLDSFTHEGFNGLHQCLVLELLGPSAVAQAESYKDYRLPGRLAWRIARQTVEAVALLHSNDITHGGVL